MYKKFDVIIGLDQRIQFGNMNNWKNGKERNLNDNLWIAMNKGWSSNKAIIDLWDEI